VEARWRLVETAWTLNVGRNLIAVRYEPVDQRLWVPRAARRLDGTSCRDALNGYQRGRCFYCRGDVSIQPGDAALADVDHFFPHTLKPVLSMLLDSVWNQPVIEAVAGRTRDQNRDAHLVLACRECNRGPGGKFDRLPTLRLLERLHRHNEHLIQSHHPLRETLTQQTGPDEPARRGFLQRCYAEAKRALIHTWAPQARRAAIW
jgi:hypothetical protein